MKPVPRAYLHSTLWLSLSACGSAHVGPEDPDATAPPPDAAAAPDALALADATSPLDAGVAPDDAHVEPPDAAMDDAPYCYAVDDANVLCRG